MTTDYKPKPPRIMDKLRMMWKKPAGGKDKGPYSTGGADPNTGSPTVPYQNKPPRKGRPDGA